MTSDLFYNCMRLFKLRSSFTEMGRGEPVEHLWIPYHSEAICNYTSRSVVTLFWVAVGSWEKDRAANGDK